MVHYHPPEDWQQWVDWLAAGLHGRNRGRLSLVLLGIVFARGRRTVTAWLRAVGIRDDFADYYYFLQPLGRKAGVVAARLLTMMLIRLPVGDRLLMAVDDSPTKRYGPHVQGAGIHHNPTPGPADQKFLYGHVWVTFSLVLRHPLWNTIGLPLLGLMYVRAKDIGKIPPRHGWRFRTKLQLAARQLLRFANMAETAGKAVWVVADGAYAKRPFLKPLRAAAGRGRRAACGRTPRCIPSPRRRKSPHGAVRVNMEKSGSIWRAARPIPVVGKRSAVSFMDSRSPKPSRRSRPPIVRRRARSAW